MKAFNSLINKDSTIKSNKTGSIIHPYRKEFDYFHNIGNAEFLGIKKAIIVPLIILIPKDKEITN